MRWLSALMSGTMLLGVLWMGCGSTDGNDDQLVFQFLYFDSTGITQADSVGETSANVDVVQGFCDVAQTIPEPFTDTLINAVFRNNEASDILLEQVVIDIPGGGIAPIVRNLTAVIPGGQCSNFNQQCASDLDCQGVIGACLHMDTTISDILLFDFEDKEHVIYPATYNVSITFFGSDPNRSYETSTHYVVDFDNFNNCTQTGG
jgi:hypothetical protein